MSIISADNWISRSSYCKIMKYRENKNEEGFEKIDLSKLRSISRKLFKGKVYFNEIRFYNYSGKKEDIIEISNDCLVVVPKRIRHSFEVSSDGKNWLKVFEFPFYTKFIFLREQTKLKIKFSNSKNDRFFTDLIFLYAS